jgi:prepilin-type N-terminal cleavage/methylation domain-containing protein
MKRKNYLDFVLSGMTLVELLVVMAIMAILVAISIPALKPMLESQRAASAARAVSLKLQQTRLKAKRENRPCGVEFMRFDNENRVSMQMRTVKNAPNFTELYDGIDEIRCRVNNGEITLVKRTASGEWQPITFIPQPGDPRPRVPPPDIWQRKVTAGLKIQFGRIGTWHTLKDSETIEDTSLTLPFDQTVVGSNFIDAVEFNVTQRPVSMLNAITVLPRGTVIDLQQSGYETSPSPPPPLLAFSFNNKFEPVAVASNIPKSVVVMFSPAGYVDRFYVDGNENQCGIAGSVTKPFRGVFYFLVGEWDKIVAGEDGKNNLETPSNFWVTIKDHDGTVRTSPNSANDNDRIEHAREDLSNNIGGL